MCSLVCVIFCVLYALPTQAQDNVAGHFELFIYTFFFSFCNIARQAVGQLGVCWGGDCGGGGCVVPCGGALWHA